MVDTIKPRSHHDIAQSRTNVPTKYIISTPGFGDVAQTSFYRSKSLWQGQSSNQGHTMTHHTYTTNQYPYQVSTTYTLQFLRYSPDKIFKLKVTTARSSVKSRSHYDVAHLHPQPMPLPSIFFLHLTVSEIQSGQTFCRRTPAHLDTMGENNTPRALKGQCDITTL